MATNITAKGVTASASDGLTTLAGKISQIQTGTSTCKLVQGTFTTGSTRGGTGSVSITYSGSGHPIACMVFVDGGAYNSDSTTGNTTWYNSVNRYDVGTHYMTKARIPSAPSYTTSGAANYGVVTIIYKNSTTKSTTYTRTSSMTANTYTSSDTNAAASTLCVRFKGKGKTLAYYVGGSSDTTIGLAPSTTYAYIIVYSA